MWTKKLVELKPWTGRAITYVSLTVFGVVALTRNQSLTDSIASFQKPQETLIEVAVSPSAKRSFNDLSGMTLDEVKVWNDLARWQGTPPAKRLFESLGRDEFTSTQPFYNFADVKPLKDLLHLGIKDFKRSLYRSPQFLMAQGYDIVKYEITHPNGWNSYVVAYKRSMENMTAPMGIVEDARPTFTLFVIAQSAANATSSLYENGTLKSAENLETVKALAGIDQWIDMSTPFLASY